MISLHDKYIVFKVQLLNSIYSCILKLVKCIHYVFIDNIYE